MNLSAFEKRAILNVAKSVQPIKNKLTTIDKKIVELLAEKEFLNSQINNIENTILPFTNGFKSDELVNVTPVAGGATKYTWKYPDTILPAPAVGLDMVAEPVGELGLLPVVNDNLEL